MIHELSTRTQPNRIRRGRGISAGRGKTAGRGTKGQNSRSGGGVRPGFEGGQNPLTSRIPKLPGFTSRRPVSQTVTTTQINQLKNKTVDYSALAEAKIIDSAYRPVRLVAADKPTKALIVKLTGASTGAVKLIEAAGGTFTATPIPKKPAKPKSSKTKD